MQMKANSLQLLLLIVCSGLSVHLSVAFVRPPATNLRLESRHPALFIRGGEQQPETATSSGADASSTSTKNPSAAVVATLPMTLLTTFGEYYGNSLRTNPILTKSVTAGSIFVLSDYLAQRLEDSKGKLSWKRMLSGGLVGLLYFGPAAHYWYDMIFRLLPGTSLVSTLQKALMGQLFFGPSFTCIFFAVSLLQSGQFTFGNWATKIRKDLPGAWLAGAGFWPLVDLVSYSLIAKNWIPLFVNMCSLVWTIYLSLVANRSSTKVN